MPSLPDTKKPTNTKAAPILNCHVVETCIPVAVVFAMSV